ncbi:MAG: 3-hydroxyacyl-CoA dehydrogenase family protein [Celeribacter sp.]|jgi:3-hydroxyacyl-CoA dehydrogenase
MTVQGSHKQSRDHPQVEAAVQSFAPQVVGGATGPDVSREADLPQLAAVRDPAAIRRFRVRRLDPAGRAALRACLRDARCDAADDSAALLMVFDTPLSGVADADLAALATEIELAAPPVFALIDTDLAGPAAELALAARARIARPDASLAFDAVRLALPPGAGASQRLPRLVGAEAALELLCSGVRIDAATAEVLGAVDLVTEARLAPVVRHLARAALPPARARREGIADPLTFQKTIAAARADEGRLGPPHLPEVARRAVTQQIIAGIESAVLLSFEAGLNLEATLREEACEGPVAPALVHLDQAWPAEAPGTALGRIGLTGGGSRGATLAAAAALAGVGVTLADRSAPHLSLAETRTRRALHPLLGEGDAGADRLDMQLGWDGLAELPLVIETLPGQAAARPALLAELAAATKGAQTVLVSSSDRPDLPHLARSLPQHARGRLVAMRLPGLRLPQMRLRAGYGTASTGVVEIIAGPDTQPDAIAMVQDLAAALALPSVMAGPVEGFLSERMLWALRIGADSCLDAGARPAEVDAALLRAGFALRPYRQIDALGLGRAEADRARLQESSAAALPQTGIAGALRRLGWNGRLAGLGYYDYDGGAPAEHPDMGSVLDSVRAGRGRAAPGLTPEQIVTRCLLAVTVEAVRLLAARRVTDAAVLDLTAVRGTGLPAHMGGPLHWAARRGLLRVKTDLTRLEAQEGGFWTPPPLIADLVKHGRRFDDLPAQALDLEPQMAGGGL